MALPFREGRRQRLRTRSGPLLQLLILCFDKFLKFISKNSYIQMAIFVHGFCEASGDAFYLIMRNAARNGAVNSISGIITIIGRFLIVTLTTALSCLLIVETISESLTSIWAPLFFIAFISSFIADIFIDVYDMSVATILQVRV